jgi:putative oxidoreductase
MQLVDYAFLLARALLAATFIISAVRHTLHWSDALAEMKQMGLPPSPLMMTGSVALRLAGGVLVLLGIHPRLGASLLLLFLVPATFTGHAFWRMPRERRGHEQIEFLNNLCMTGGVLLLAIVGGGPLSLSGPL